MDTSNMQDMMTATSSNNHVQQSVIQNTGPMNLNHQPTSTNSLLYTASIYSQDLSQQHNQQQQMMSMHQNHQQQPNESSQAMMSDLNPFLSGGGMNSQTQQPMEAQAESDEKDGRKFSRGYLKAQLPWVKNFAVKIKNLSLICSKREPHNYDKCQPTAHQTTIYNQMLAQHQEAPQQQQQLYQNSNNNTVYGENLADLNNINHMSPIQTVSWSLLISDKNFNIDKNINRRPTITTTVTTYQRQLKMSWTYQTTKCRVTQTRWWCRWW